MSVTEAANYSAHFTDAGAGQTVSGWTPPTTNATETPYQQNTNLTSASSALKITVFGADASKPFPNPANATAESSNWYSGTTYLAATSLTEPGTTAVAIARYSRSISCNVATQSEEVDEDNLIHLPASNGLCRTGCLTTAAAFTDLVNSFATAAACSGSRY